MANGADVNLVDEYSTATQVSRKTQIHPITGKFQEPLVSSMVTVDVHKFQALHFWSNFCFFMQLCFKILHGIAN